ncbi:WD40 repeat protein [Catenulispora sp. GAS73]|uniref:caspase family protein n=1 Tax=Catenulispora sp. GAS73 TaxID=3156269 RepID=UPI003518322E
MDARENIVELFTGTLGYRYHAMTELDPSRQQLLDGLRAFCTSPLRREDDLLAVYLSCHGTILGNRREHVLFTADTDPADETYTSLRTADLASVLLRDTKLRHVMLLLDACYSGQGGNELAATALRDLGDTWDATTESGSSLVIIVSAQPHEQAEAAAFPQLLSEAVGSLRVTGYGPVSLPIGAIVQHMNDSQARPRYQHSGFTMTGLHGRPPDFFHSPRHDPDLTDVTVAVQQATTDDARDPARQARSTAQLVERAMAYHGVDVKPGWWFCGRKEALIELAGWLNAPLTRDRDEADATCRVVVGGPGSGKSAVLGVVAALADPERRRSVPVDALDLPRSSLPELGSIDLVLSGSQLTAAEALRAIAGAVRISGAGAGSVGDLLEALPRNRRQRPVTILIDALDEAADPDELCARVLRPLIRHSEGRIRLLLGTRADLVPRLGVSDAAWVDLDSPRYADPAAITAYAVRSLIEAHPSSPYRLHPEIALPVAEAVAAAADKSFLVARIVAGTLAAEGEVVPDPADPAWRAGLPAHARSAMTEDLATRLHERADVAVDLLRPLAFAQGKGLPWEDLWAPLASAISGREYSDEHLFWLRQAAGSYAVESVDDGRSVYRLFHRSLAELLTDGIDDTMVHTALTQTLSERVPYRNDGGRDWRRAHPYTLRHIAFHARCAGLLDDIVTDAEFLVHVAPRDLAPHLGHTRSDTARAAGAVYRAALDSLTDTTHGERRALLSLEAARAGAHVLHRELIARMPVGDWAPVWATGATAARATLDGSPEDIWAEHVGRVWSVAFTELDGVPVAVTGSADTTVRIWDLRTGQLVREPLTEHTDEIFALACANVDGTPLAITGGEGTVRIWDLRTGQRVSEDSTTHTGMVWSVACTEIDGLPVAVTGGADGMVRIWSLRTGRQLGEPLPEHADEVYAVACTEVDGLQCVVTGSKDGAVRIWDLRTRKPVGEPMTEHTGAVFAVACTTIDGTPLAVTGGKDGAVRVWDLRTRQLVGEPMTEHTGAVFAVACTSLNGTPLAITGAKDGTVRSWDLRTRTAFSPHLTLTAAAAIAVNTDGYLAVGLGHDLAVFQRRMRSKPTVC